MIQVKFVREIGVGLAGVATIVGGLPACSSSPGQTGSTSNDDTTATPIASAGTGAISMNYFDLTYASTSSGDEFIRVGETLSFNTTWTGISEGIGLYESTLTAADFATTAIISFPAFGSSPASSETLPITFDAQGNGTTPTFVVPQVPSFTISLAATNKQSQQTKQISTLDHASFAVFGAFLPSREILFDNDSTGAVRERVIEGGSIVAGANVTLSYSDWRADRLVNKDSLNLTIGQGDSYSRFGSAIANISGVLSYNITAVYSTDGGNTWGGPVALNADSGAPSLSTNPMRTAYEVTVPLPGGASDFRVAFHIQAVLTANPQYEYINTWDTAPDGTTYTLGSQYVLVDTWDNDSSADGYYDFPVAPAGASTAGM